MKKRKIVYILLILYAGVFLTSGIGAPVTAHFNQFELANKFYGLMSLSCHQNPLRSFWIFGYPMALCSRCSGIYLGSILTLLLLIFKDFRLKSLFIILLLLMVITEIVLEKVTILEGNNFIRFISGNICGFIFIVLFNNVFSYLIGFFVMKNIKRIMSFILCISLFMFQMPAFSLGQKPLTLQEFIQTHNKIKVIYNYPSIKLAANNVTNITAAPVNKVKIPAGTPVIIRSADTLNSKAIVSGSTVSFIVERDVKIDDKTVVRAGSDVQAHISYAKKRGMVGEPGVIQISDFVVNAVDGTFIPLRASIFSSGEDKSDTALLMGILLCLPFLMIKGGNAEIPAGTVKTVFTNSDASITLKESL